MTIIYLTLFGGDIESRADFFEYGDLDLRLDARTETSMYAGDGERLDFFDFLVL